ncbi:MAG: TetR/AcrR family transcriptional regulator [Parvibaculaceae bacterium]|nr:TetR/AcrR family transcriptional regulator [Parvibaculaceae bacterium]HBM89539.1 TetR/AcrR family transcriptional regulator [Rhodobiaceae bacterium]
MARTAATPEQRAQIRDQIRQAAAEVYEEKGVAGTSARAIALKAGMSVGTLYGYYANLPDLMRSLWAEPVAEEMERLRASVAETSDPLEALQLLLDGYAAFAFSRPDILKGAFLFVRIGDGSPLEPAAAAIEFRHMLRDAVLAGQNSGQIKRGSPDQIAHQLWAGVHGALALPINIESLEFGSPKQLVADMIAMLMESIKA